MAEREGARARAAEAHEAHEVPPQTEVAARDERPAEAVAAAPRRGDAERARAATEATVEAGEAVGVRDRSVSAVKRTGNAVKRGVRTVAVGARKVASASGGWFAGEMKSDWNRTALGFGERVRKAANLVGNVIFNPIMRIGAAMEDWGAGYPPFSWFKKKADISEDQKDMFEDYGKGEGKK